MADLRPIPLAQLLRRMIEEPAHQGTIFDLPLRKAWRPRREPALDLSVETHGRRAQTPVGPAAGPHAQLAQNIVLAWLGGSRVIELKTVQRRDDLEIPRPCIDAATVGFNVEWSQELKLADSLREYVAGWILIDVCARATRSGFGERAAREAKPVFELSVGYDLAGLTSPEMQRYLEQVRDVAPIAESLRAKLPRELAPAVDGVATDAKMVSCVTLSTFHGCPAGEIEAIARHLIDRHDMDVIVKLNPTLLGYDEVCYLVHERMGYHELKPKRAAFDGDLRWEDALSLGRSLAAHARGRGRKFGVKMTNTLVVENHKSFFSGEEMYLSGAPLHVLAMHCVERWRNAFAESIPISFSGGIDQHNFADAVACDLVPVTTCTDLLRPGGYGRLARYLENLEEAMVEHGAGDRDDFLLRRFGKGPEAVRNVMAEVRERDERIGMLGDPHTHDAAAAERLLGECEARLVAAAKGGDQGIGAAIAQVRASVQASGAPEAARVLVDEIAGRLGARIVAAAGALNTHEVTARVTGDPRYAASKNGKPPRKVGTTLVLLDCLSCDKCVPVCPNDANFVLETPPEELPSEDVTIDGDRIARAPGATFKVGKPEQWASFADACNECGNCDVFCPEDGGPYVMKARFFGSAASFESTRLDGLLVGERGQVVTVRARIEGREYRLELDGARGELDDGRLRVSYDAATGRVLDAQALAPGDSPHALPGTIFLTLRALTRGALAGRWNPVSAAVAARFPRAGA